MCDTVSTRLCGLEFRTFVRAADQWRMWQGKGSPYAEFGSGAGADEGLHIRYIAFLPI